MSWRDDIALKLRDQVRGGGTWKRTICGFCEGRVGSPDHRGNWALNSETGYYHCFRCGVKGFLPGFEPRDVKDLAPPPVDLALMGAPEGFMPLTEDALALEHARRYVMKRGISKKIAIATGIGAVLTGRKLKQRIVVPIFGADGRTWIGWSARLFNTPVTPWDPKYRYPDLMDLARTVYNQIALQTETEEPCLCVEGVFDALPYYPNVSAFLGKPTTHQLPFLLAAKRPLVICLDGDAWCEGQMLCERLRFMSRQAGRPLRVGWVRLPPKQDPNSVDRVWLNEQVKRAV